MLISHKYGNIYITMHDPNFRPGPLDAKGNHYQFEPANPGWGVDGTYGEPLLKAHPYEQQQWRTWVAKTEFPEHTTANMSTYYDRQRAETTYSSAPQQLGQVPLHHMVQAPNPQQGWPNVTSQPVAAPVQTHERASSSGQIRSSEIIVDEEKIDVNDRIVFAHTGRHMMQLEDSGGMNIYAFDPRSQQREVAAGPTYGPLLPFAMRNLLEDRGFGRFGELPSYKFAEPPKNFLAPDARGFGGASPDNSERRRFYEQKEQEVHSLAEGKRPPPSLVQIEQGGVSWTVLSLGGDYGNSVGRGMTTFAVEGNQSMDQMFERAQVAFPNLFEIIPKDEIMQRPPRFQRISLPDSPMAASFKGSRSSRVA